MEAFLDSQLDKFNAGGEEEPPQCVAESAQPEQVTSGLQQKLARGPLRKRKEDSTAEQQLQSARAH